MQARHCEMKATVSHGWLCALVVLSSLMVYEPLKAQTLPGNATPALVPGIIGPDLRKMSAPPASGMSLETTPFVSATPEVHKSSAFNCVPGRVCRITLEQAAQQSAAEGPMVQLAKLQVEAARQHRLGTESDYFPKISSTLTNFHFNKFMGEALTFQRPIAGGTATASLPLAGKDQTLIAVTAAQPVTPLFKLREVVNIARADEQVARAKAGMPVETASVIEKDYYGLLVAQRELTVARAKAGSLRNDQLVASNAALSVGLPKTGSDDVTAIKALVSAEMKVKELTTSLNQTLGLPLETELELVAPSLPLEEISLQEAVDKATAANPEVVEAEQTAVKARAAQKLSKLDYIPDVAVLGGYAYNNNAIPLLPRDFSFIGFMGSYTLFDFGKREHTVKERNAQVSAAEMAVQLTKQKVAASVKTSYFEMERSRRVSELTHRVADALPIQRVSYDKDASELALSRATIEVEMFQADLEYRQALGELKTLMGER